MSKETSKTSEKPFEGMKIYFSGPIIVANGGDSNFNFQICEFLKENGATVLDEHVGGKDAAEIHKRFREKWGRDEADPVFVRSVDIEGVDSATHLIAVVTKPSLGIGMELQRALDRPEMGKTPIPILCLKEDDGTPLSKMVTGVSPAENSNFEIGFYNSPQQALEIVSDFLHRHSLC